tara:strand:+ start:358 stop:903 length:546 start_codon:yes stop_codon:yes gene_type:complete
MNPKLTEILKKAKAVDKRASQIDRGKITGDNTMTPTLTESMTMQPNTTSQMGLPSSRPQPKIDVNSEAYRQRVEESNLPPEIRKAMLDNPIQQADSPGTFSMSEEMIKEVNPNYGETITEASIPSTTTKSSVTVNNSEIRKMIAEEIAKALPSIVEKYFDKKMIQENIRTLKSLKIKPIKK